MKQLRFLAVDDNQMNLTVLTRLLGKETLNGSVSITCDTALSGQECIQKCQETPYDLIFMDHMMPDMDGVETARILLHRGDAAVSHLCDGVPIVALTANAEAGSREYYLAEGFHDYMMKPVMPPKLKELLMDLFGIIQTDEPDASMEQKAYKELPQLDGVDWALARLHFSDDEDLLDAVGNFYDLMDSGKEKLIRLYEILKAHPEDTASLSEYRIQVHSMKSSSNMIGIFPLGGMAWVLEKAAKTEDLKTILYMTPFFLKEWMRFKSHLVDIVPSQDAAVLTGGNQEEAMQSVREHLSDHLTVLQKMEEGAEFMDLDALDEGMKYFKEKSGIFGADSEMDRLIIQLNSAVIELDDTNIQKICKELREVLEKLTDF